MRQGGKMFLLFKRSLCVFIIVTSLCGCTCHTTLPLQWPSTNLVVLPVSENGVKAQDLFSEAITKANNSIDLVMYSLSDPVLVQDLIDAKKRGLSVRIIKEKQIFKHENNISTASDRTLERLQNAGIEVHSQPQRFLEKNPKSQAHDKILVVDGAYAILSSGNWDSESLAHTRDFAVAITPHNDPKALQEIKDVFEADWNNQPIETTVPTLIWGPDGQREGLTQLLESAQSSVYVYQQSYNDPQLAKILEQKAKIGVEVKLLMMPFPFGGTDHNNPFQEALIAAGGEVKFNLEYYMHAKAIIIDNKIIYIGSCNFYPSSIESNRELGWLTSNAEIVANLRFVFSHDWLKATEYLRAKNVKKDWNLQ